MMRDPRRRSPESSRRRRRESRRDSRDQQPQPQLTNLPPMPMSQGSTSYTNLPGATTTAPSMTAATTTADRGGYDYQPYQQQYQQPYQPYQQQPQQPQQQYQQQHPTHQYPPGQSHHQRPRAPSSSDSSSSSISSSLLDISRHYPHSSRFGGVFGTFFRAPSERSRLRRRRSGGARKRRILYFGNSSSSSVNSDLAYGNGYIARPNGRSPSPRESFGAASSRTAAAAGVAAGVAATAATAAGRSQQHRGPAAGYATDGSNRPGPRRAKTDEEILELGRQLQDFARKQNGQDLKASGRSRPSGLMAAATSVSDFRRKRRGGTANRGIGSSRPHNGSSGDESDWESASDDEWSDGADSELAYGSVVSHALRPGMAAVAGAAAGAAVASRVGGRSSHGTQTSAVDPRLFGPVNSLHGLVTPQPFRDGDSAVPAAQYRDFNRLRRAETEPIHKTPMKDVYPVPATDPTKFDADTASMISSRQGLPYRSRPEPVPLQQPVPKTPVSPKVYQAEKLEEASRRDLRDHRPRTEDKGPSDVALAGIGMAAAGAAAMAFNRKKSRDERKTDRRDDRDGDKRDSRELRDYRDDERRSSKYDKYDKYDKTDKDSKRKDKESDRDKERRISKRDSYSSKYTDDRDHKRSSRREDEDTPRKRRETSVDHYPEPQTRTYRNGEIEVELDPAGRSEVSRSSRRESRKYDDRDDRRDLPTKAKKAGSERAVGPDNYPLQKTPVDPFQYLIHDSDLAAPEAGPARPLTPTVVTVEREPTFSDWPPRPSMADTRLSRKDSFEIERMVEDYKKGSQGAPRSPEPRRRNTYEEEEKTAKSVYEETKHSTAAVAAGAIAAAVAAETMRSRSRSRSRSRTRWDERSGGDARGRKGAVDSVQEEANRAYREAAIARKIAEDEIRSRSQTPDRSVMDRYKDDDKDEAKIVTPPQYQESHKDPDTNPYDKPNADVRIDNKIFPKEIHKFRANGLDAPLFKSRDPSCERDRPLLNLVYPTPVTSRQATPSPDHAVREKDTRDRGETSRSATEVVVEEEDDATQPSSAKSVTWGKNSTKSFEVETPEPRSDTEPTWAKAEEKPRPRLNQSSQWGIIAAAIAGSSREPANEIEVKESKEHDGARSRDFAAAGPEHDFADDSVAPPVPGPKPPSPHPERMPGGFGDDIEFAATLAAGLKDTGFDPNIVIDDPAYRRRDSPPGESEPNGDSWNHTSFADVVTDLTGAPGERSVPEPGYVVGEVETPRDEAAADEWAEVPAKLSKKEKKRLEKLKRQSAEMSEPIVESSETPTYDDAPEAPEKLSKKEQRKRDKAAKSQAFALDEPTAAVAESEPSQARDAGDDLWEETGRKKSKKNRKSRDFEDDASSKVSVPTDAFEDLQSLRNVDPDDEWDTAKQSKKKSKRDSGVYEATSHAASEVSVDSSGKRSSKSKRRSGVDDDFDDYGDGPPDTRKSDPFEDREVSSVVSDGRYDDRKREKREKRRSSRYDDDDTKSVASAPGGSSSRRSKDKEPETTSSRYDDDDTKSIASAPGGPSRRSRDKDSDKRSSRYDDDDAKSVASAPDSSSRRSRVKEPEKRSSGLFSSIFKSKDDKKDSFLGNAGTPGAGAGFATAAAAAAAYMAASRSHATEDDFVKGGDAQGHADDTRDFDAIDPEVAPRAIKPAIDPQYGDLLPLPPSEPGSPIQAPEELPTLPDSRPDTPPDERNLKRGLITHRRRRSAQETPVKSPSRTAIPISLRLGSRASPSTPGSSTFRSPPLDSPVSAPDSATRRQARHISWDSSREIKPLYLLEHSRHSSADAVSQQTDFPELPPSEPSSRESPAPEFQDADDVVHRGLSAEDLADTGLRIDTSVGQLPHEQDLAGSQETTPKAEAKPDFQELPPLRGDDDQSAMYVDPDPVESMSKDRSSYLLRSTPSSIRSNKAIDSDNLAPSHWESSPSKRLGVDDLQPEHMDDLTSADEHFSDAREGTPDDAFEEAQSWPAERHAVEQPVEELFESNAPKQSSHTAEEAEPDEWKTMTAKEKKKAKKARKNKGLDFAEAAVASAAVGTAAAIAATALTQDSHKEDSSSPQPEPSQDDFDQPKKGKKGKKNKRKSLSWEDNVDEKPAEPANADAETFAVERAEVRETAIEKDEPFASEPAELSDPISSKDIPEVPPMDIVRAFDPKDEPGESIAEEPALRESHDPAAAETEKEPEVLDMTDPAHSVDIPAAAEGSGALPTESVQAPPAEEDFWMAPTKKSKKKKKGKAAMTWDESPPTEIEAPTQPDDIAANQPGETSLKGATILDGPPASEPIVADEEPPIAPEVEQVAQEPSASAFETETATETNADDFWSVPATSKKDKKKKKKGKQTAIAWDDDTPAAESGTQTPADVVDTDGPSVRELAEPASEAITPDVAETSAQAEASFSAPEAAAEADAEDMWSTPASSKKDKKKKKKASQAMAWEEPQAPEPEFLSQQPAGEEKGSLAGDEPLEDSQDGAKSLEISADIPATERDMGEAPHVEPGSSSQQESAPSFSDPPTAAEPDDEWSVPTTSKKDKKKKKRKSLLFEEPAPTEQADIPAADDEPPVEVAKRSDHPVDQDTKPPFEPAIEDATSTALESDFAPVTKGKKKKNKRKSVQWEPEEAPAAPEPEPAALDKTPDTASIEASRSQDTTALEEPPAESHEGTSFASTAAMAAAATATALAADLGHDVITEVPAEAAKETQDRDAEQSLALESHISEPLFSQDAGHSQLTQEPSSIDPTQVDEPGQEQTSIGPTQVDDPAKESMDVAEQPAAEGTFEDFAVPKKKKGKKNKKSQSSVWDLIEEDSSPKEAEPVSSAEKSLDDQIPEEPPALQDDVMALAANPVDDKPAEEPVTMADDQASKELSADTPPVVASESQSEDEWDRLISGKKSKKSKKKGSKSAPMAEQEQMTEPSSEPAAEPVVLTEEPARIEEPTTDAAPVEPSQESTGADEWPQVTSKKGKKKKRQSQMSSTWDDEPVASTAPAETFESAETSAPSVDPEAEFEVPKKKGKKDKKKKNVFSWDSLDVETPPESEAKVQDLAHDDGVPQPETATAEMDIQPLEQATLPEQKDVPGDEDFASKTLPETEQELEALPAEPESKAVTDDAPVDPSISEPGPLEAPAADESEFLFPVKMSKKDKKKKKKLAALDEAAQLDSTESTAKDDEAVPVLDEASLDRDIEQGLSSDRAVEETQASEPVTTMEEATQQEDPVSGDTPGASEQQSEANPDDEWGGFSLKKSKKDKKKKKAKNVEPEIPQEPEATTQPEPEPATLVSLADQAAESSRMDIDAPIEPPVTDAEPLSSHAEDLAETPVPAEVAVVDEPDKKDDDDDWSFGLSKKDKKKKKKARALEVAAEESSTPSDADAPRELDVGKEPAESDFWSTASKKDKKKKRKSTLAMDADEFADKAAQPDGDAAALPETTADSAPLTVEQDSIMRDEPADASPVEASDTIAEQPSEDLQRQSELPQEPESLPTAQAEDEVKPEESAPEPNPDDEWSVPVTTKKGKKGKKGRKSQVEVLPWEESTAESSGLPATDPVPMPEDQVLIDKATTEAVSTVAEEAMEAPTSEDIELAESARPDTEMHDATQEALSLRDATIADAGTIEPDVSEQQPDVTKPEEEPPIGKPTQDIADPEDIWNTMPQRKLSKKDKKKSKKQAGLLDESAEPSTDTSKEEPASASQPLEESLPGTADEPRAPPVFAEEMSGEPEEWLPTKKSKKDKKKAQNLAAAAAAGAATGAAVLGLAAGDSTDSPADEVPEPKTLERTSQPAFGSWADEMDDVAPIAQTETPPEEPQPAPEADDDGFGFQMTSKKSKKGKKKGKTSLGPAELNAETAPTSEAELQTEPAAPEGQRMETGGEVSRGVDNIDSQTTSQVPELAAPAEAEDEWAMPVKKKGKKGKKAKGSGTLTPANEPEVSIAPEVVAPLQSSEDVQGPALDDYSETVPEVTQAPSPVPEQPQPSEDVDEWAFTTKKGKKGKKGRKSSGFVTPANEPESLPEPPSAEAAPEATEETALGSTVSSEFKIDEAPEPTVEHLVLESTSPEDRSLEHDTLMPDQPTESALPENEGAVATASDPAEPMPAEEATAYDSWAFPVKKKGKKGKKGKSTSGSMTPVPSLDDQAVPSDPSIKDKDLDFPIQETAAAHEATTEEPLVVEASRALQEPTPPAEAEDEWAMPSKKKKGKGKKNKGAPWSAFDEPAVPPEEPSQPDTLIVDEGQPASSIPEVEDAKPMAMEQTPDPEPLTTSDPMDVEARGDSAFTREPEPIAAEPSTAPPEASPEDAWAVPGRKKSKKEKKRKSSQVMVLDSPRDETPVQEEAPRDMVDDMPMEEGDSREQPASDDWFDDFSVPKSQSSVTKSKKKKGKKSVEATPIIPRAQESEATEEASGADKVPVDEPLQDAAEDMAGGTADDEATQSGANAFDDVWESDPRLPGNSARAQDMSAFGAEELPSQHDMDKESSRALENSPTKDETRARSSSSGADAAASASALSGGVALLAERFGGSKKKKKGKQSKIVDKRQHRDDDIFDDPALWEGADKKSLQTDQGAKMGDTTWGGNTETAEPSKAREPPVTAMSESFTESESGWKETARQGVPLDDEFAESPVLGRGETSDMSMQPVGLLRRGSEVEEPIGGLLREREEAEARFGSLSPAVSEFKRSPTRALPAVEEVPEAEDEAAKLSWPTPEMNRDSGFAAESPNPTRRRSNLFDDGEAQRDSGVHTGDWTEGMPRTMPRTPEPPQEKRSRHSPYGTPVLVRDDNTPVLRGPTLHGQATPEPEKKLRRTQKSYGELGGDATGLTAPRRRAADKDDDKDRSVSDGVAMAAMAHKQQRQAQLDPSPRAEPRRSASNTSLSRHRTPEPLRFRPESPGITRATATPTPPLRRVDKRMSGDLRALRQQSSVSNLSNLGGGSRSSTPATTTAAAAAASASASASAAHAHAGAGAGALGAATLGAAALGTAAVAASALQPRRDKDRSPSSSSTSPPPPPIANESRVRSNRDADKDMADVFDGYGEGRIGSPRSPTRPHSMRRRQSMQVLELESRVQQLLDENRALTDARTHAEQNLNQRAATVLSDRDAEIEALKQSLQFLQNEVNRLTEVNEGLASANAELASKDNGARYADLEVRHATVSRELDEARGAHSGLDETLQAKDAEIADLRAQLEAAKEQIRDMQRKILESKSADAHFLVIKDEDYFDNRCQQLCSHVQQWVLRFSKFSDMRACRLTSEINDEKTIDRLDNAVLDGSDVDTYLNDRVKRRDIFMSMTMNMIWEFVFTRYLFGMDREQRQKLKSLEKLLLDVGPSEAVRQWRAVTLTLLSRRDNFKEQRDLDTEAVVQAIFQTLCKILPPPGNLEDQIQSQLRRVMREAVDLSVEMRTQRAEYMMLPPLQPEYDADGELAATVQFDASMMNERSGKIAETNEELEARGAIVRIVLFPLVVKRGDDAGVGEDKIVVCPAQVLIARDKSKRHPTPSSDAGGASLGAPSRVSVVTEHMGTEADYMEGGI
ncbi:involucrin repeat protein [Purpureocillium lavendulum]|uniref:Involucrin repeat protein n=1 Tax=Purpureocillium lavendulum TaxID=1247861 RepID=A0AB34G353_9HYPO|nr:involucrin repeat protein [Purpureocillium lavendulum]